MASPSGQPALCCRQLTILFLLAVLCNNKLRRQRHHATLPGRDDDGGDHGVAVQGFAVFQRLPGTAGAGNLFLTK